MARVTVEDCIDKVPNRFELVLLSAHRARALATGSHMTVDRENDKNAVIALREMLKGQLPQTTCARGSYTRCNTMRRSTSRRQPRYRHCHWWIAQFSHTTNSPWTRLSTS